MIPQQTKIRITWQMIIDAGRNPNAAALNRHQFAQLNIPWPLKSGWMNDLIGTEIDQKTWDLVLALKGQQCAERKSIIADAGGIPVIKIKKPRKKHRSDTTQNLF